MHIKWRQVNNIYIYTFELSEISLEQYYVFPFITYVNIIVLTI